MEFPKDEFGPEYVVRVYDPAIGMEGFLVIHNTVLGLGKGGIRMTPNVTADEVFRLASTMTWKNALAGIPFGGAKAGMVWPSSAPSGASAGKALDDTLKKQFVQSFARTLKPFLIKKYIAGPDVNSGEKEMQWFAEAVGDWRAATGKPARMCIKTARGKKCGLPHELGSTGFGVAHATAVAAPYAGIDLKKATVAIHGFGNVATFAFEYLTRMGATVVALSSSKVVVYEKNGLDPKTVRILIKKSQPLTDYPKKAQQSPESFWTIPADILIPASVTDVINQTNKNGIRTKLIVEGGNIPMREDIESELFRRGIMIVPDFVANAGGVISSYAEYRGLSPKRMFEIVEQKIKRSTELTMKEVARTGINPREAALAIAQEKVRAKMKKI